MHPVVVVVRAAAEFPVGDRADHWYMFVAEVEP